MLKLKELTVEYQDGTRAINEMTFSIDTGENVALIGANGAGKTSLILALVGILQAKRGTVQICGISVEKKSLRDIRSRIGLVFQNPDDQLFMPTIHEDVAFGPRSYGCCEGEVERRVNGALSSLGIVHLADRSPLKLSGGEKRLAAIATVLAMDPDFLLFDEPTAFLDPRARRNLTSVLLGLPQGKLIATHDLPFAKEVCTRVLLIQGGKLMADGARELLTDTDTLEAAGL